MVSGFEMSRALHGATELVHDNQLVEIEIIAVARDSGVLLGRQTTGCRLALSYNAGAVVPVSEELGGEELRRESGPTRRHSLAVDDKRQTLSTMVCAVSTVQP